MKNELFPLFLVVCEFSIILSVQVAFLLCLRPLVNRWFGAVVNYRMWLFPVLWMPVFWLGRTTDIFISLTATGADSTVWFGQVFSGIQFTEDYSLLPDFSGATSGLINTGLLISIVWLSVMFVLLIHEIYRINVFSHFVRLNAMLVPDHEQSLIKHDQLQLAGINLCYLNGIRSPALYGIFKPVLLLPEDFMSSYDENQRHIMLAHESVHLARHDNLFNLAAALLKILFWFNPLVYLGHHFYRLDQEVSCDAQALKRCTGKQVREYAGTLLATISRSGNSRLSPIMTAWDNPGQFKERIKMLNKHKAYTGNSIPAVLTLLFVCLAGAGLTACAANSTSQPKAGQQTDYRDVPPDARNQDVVSRYVFTRVNEAIVLRDEGDFSQAMAKLDELKARYEAGRMNNREQFLLWNMYANLYQMQGQTENALDSYETLLAMPSLNTEQRENTEASARRLLAGESIGARDNDLEIRADEVEMLPIVTINPEYPQNAVNNKTEGWILVSFTVDEAGDVMNPEVVDAEPADVFDESALRAISKFKFNPREVNGSAVQVADVRYLFRYNLTQ